MEDDPLDQKKKCSITPNFEQSLYEQMGARTGDIVHDTADVRMINIPPSHPIEWIFAGKRERMKILLCHPPHSPALEPELIHHLPHIYASALIVLYS